MSHLVRFDLAHLVQLPAEVDQWSLTVEQIVVSHPVLIHPVVVFTIDGHIARLTIGERDSTSVSVAVELPHALLVQLVKAIECNVDYRKAGGP